MYIFLKLIIKIPIYFNPVIFNNKLISRSFKYLIPKLRLLLQNNFRKAIRITVYFATNKKKTQFQISHPNHLKTIFFNAFFFGICRENLPEYPKMLSNFAIHFENLKTYYNFNMETAL